MIVRGEGELGAKVWLIGEAPGENECRLGRPFVGGSGVILDGMLREAGIDRTKCYVDNVIQENKPFSNYYENKHPTQELLNAHQRLQDLIAQHRPNVVVALGNEALFALTGKREITKWRGSILGCRGVKVIPTIHPSMVMRNWEFKPVVSIDLGRVKKEMMSPEFPNSYKDNFITNPSFDKINEVLDMLEAMPNAYVAFDIETATPQITCLGFAWSKNDAICIPFCYGSTSFWSSAEEVILIERLRKFFANPNINFIAQNAQYDMCFMKDKWGVEVVNLWMDTMIAFHCVYSELKKGLGFLSSIYTNRPYHKDSGEGSVENYWNYNCLDTVVTWECAMEIYKELEELGTKEFYFKHSHRLIKPLMEMQRRGVKIDLDLRTKVDANIERELIALQDKLDKSVGHPLNVSSSKQMKEFLYTELKLPEQKNKSTKAVTADEDALETLSLKFPNPIFNLILDIRGARKLLSTYIRTPIELDGRIRCSYVITGTVTGRLSSRSSIYGFGTNLQNIPRGELVRSLFVADNGKILVNADLSQAELWVVAYLANEERLQNILNGTSGDVHRQNAARIFNKRAEEITDEERTLGKTLVHAANYGIGYKTFAGNVGCTDVRATQLLNQYYTIYPCIKLWHKEVEEQLRKTRKLTTPYGRTRIFFGRWGFDLVREAIAHVPQSTVSDTINLGLVNAWYNLPNGWEILMQVHDSIMMQVPEDTEPMHLYRFINRYFVLPITVNRKTFRIPIDIKTGKNWGKMVKLDVKNIN